MLFETPKIININEYFVFAEQSVETYRGKKLSFIQKIILNETLSDQTKTYSQIAQENHYSEKYIKQVVAPKLWQLLSEALGQKVTKHNCRLVLESLLDKPSLSHTPFLHETQQNTILVPLEGQVPLGSPFYIEQDLDIDPYQEILRTGALLRIKAPRKRGKTSLMARIMNYGQAQGYHTVRLSLHRAGTNIFISEEKFLRWICASVTQQLHLESKLDEYCDEDMGSLLNCTLYFQEYLLEQIDSPLILAIDEINQLFEYPDLARNFLSLLRSWYEETRDISVWQKLRFIIVHSTDMYIPLATNKSPFNVGLVIELPPFKQEEVDDLAQRYGLNIEASELKLLMELTGGFPYLVHLVFDRCVNHNLAIKTVLENTDCETFIFHEHMHEQLWHLQQHVNLAEAFKKVLTADSAIELEIEPAFKLNSLGLINLHENGVTVSCGLYQDYFQKCCFDQPKESTLNKSRFLKIIDTK